MEPLNTCDERFKNEHLKELNPETKNLRKPVFLSKIVNPFIRTLGPPFYKKMKRLLHSEITLGSKNIPNENMHMNVFYIP
jgi:hypothetical protein